MGKIVSLSEQVISKIAAGEVIERPAYIIKELIENAIDAQAQHIHIAIEQYGMEKIIITDDGHGMDRSDISVCFKPHTTSKIATAEDLFTVKSMGFRGEALASISSIGNVIIRSRTAESPFGTEVVIENGIIQKTTSKGMPVGTQIVVSQAFSHVPVRKKFLQSTQSEYRFIIEVIHRFIIAFPSISFDFTHDGTRVFTFPSVSEHSARIDSVIPHETKKQLFEINYEDEYVKIYGYVSPPQLNYKTPRNIQFYINNRYIKEPRFISVIKEVYGTLLEPTAHPYSLFFISLPHHLVDINVHPRKESIHMMDSLNVFKALEKAISSVLAEHNLSFYDKRWLWERYQFSFA